MRQELLDLIKNQFDLEILLKHHELNVIEDEVAKIHVLMIQMKRNSANPLIPALNEPVHFTQIYSKYLQNSPEEQGTSPSTVVSSEPAETSPGYQLPLTRSKSTTNDNPRSSDNCEKNKSNNDSDLKIQSLEKPQCLIRRCDGVIVRLICPECKRENFFSPQGFINHCRISHSLEFTSHDAAAVKCGVEIDAQDELGMLAQQKKNSNEKSSNSDEATAGYTPCGAEASLMTMNNLSNFLKSKNIDIDLNSLVKRSIEKYPKGYLLDGEEDDEDEIGELGEEATTFQRALAEARRLNIDINELSKPSQAVAHSSSGRQKKRKKGGNRERCHTKNAVSGSLRPQRRYSGDTKKDSPDILQQEFSGKYKPGSAPSNWNKFQNIPQEEKEDQQVPESDMNNSSDSARVTAGGRLSKFMPLSRFFP